MADDETAASPAWAAISSIEGFFTESQYLVWRWFGAFQWRENVVGDIAEIGVWKGMSAAALSTMVRPGETLYLCDQLLSKMGAVENIRRAGFNADCIVTKEETSQMSQWPARSIRWFHIDGEHSRARAHGDLALADAALTDDGIICMDDFFHPRYVGVVWATFEYLRANPGLKLLMVGNNKAYLCRPRAFAKYREALMSELPAALKGRTRLCLHQSYSVFDCETLGLADDYGAAIDGVTGFDCDPRIVEHVTRT